MKLITELPPGAWKIVIWDDCLIAACPEHEARIIDLKTGTVSVIHSDRISIIQEVEKPVMRSGDTLRFGPMRIPL